MEVESVVPKAGGTIEVPAYELGLIGTLSAHCFTCGGCIQYWNVPFRWLVQFPYCCGRLMFGSFPTPFGNASLN
jgi:hypothetical protein